MFCSAAIAALIDVGQETRAAPALHDLLYARCIRLVSPVVVGSSVRRCLGYALRELSQHLGLASTQQHRSQRLADPVQILVANNASRFVEHLMVMGAAAKGGRACGRPRTE